MFGSNPPIVKLVEVESVEELISILIILGIDSKTTVISSVLSRVILRYSLSLISKSVPVPSILPGIEGSIGTSGSSNEGASPLVASAAVTSTPDNGLPLLSLIVPEISKAFAVLTTKLNTTKRLTKTIISLLSAFVLFNFFSFLFCSVWLLKFKLSNLCNISFLPFYSF